MPTSAEIHELEEGLLLRPKFDAAGLVTCVTTDATTGDVLMVAHMNDEALRRTVASGEAWYYSRSRGALWRKGERSGNVQRVIELRVDCDQDAVWSRVEQADADTRYAFAQASAWDRQAMHRDLSAFAASQAGIFRRTAKRSFRWRVTRKTLRPSAWYRESPGHALCHRARQAGFRRCRQGLRSGESLRPIVLTPSRRLLTSH